MLLDASRQGYEDKATILLTKDTVNHTTDVNRLYSNNISINMFFVNDLFDMFKLFQHKVSSNVQEGIVNELITISHSVSTLKQVRFVYHLFVICVRSVDPNNR